MLRYPIIPKFHKFVSFCCEGDSRNRADVNSSLQPGGGTALHLAAERGKQTCLAILLDQPETQVHAHSPQYLGARFFLFYPAVATIKILFEKSRNDQIIFQKLHLKKNA